MSEAETPTQASESEEGSREPEPCMPCHGSGKVISNLGGTPRKVACPWCRGKGLRSPGTDAQEYRIEQDGKRRP
jgi:DnaJ-class molecular chaperone